LRRGECSELGGSREKPELKVGKSRDQTFRHGARHSEQPDYLHNKSLAQIPLFQAQAVVT
jgi:hypothetical protein